MTIIAAGPKTLHLNGYVPLRIVLRDLSVPGRAKFVVHTEIFHEVNGASKGFENGTYIENGYGETRSKVELLGEAWKAFVERCDRAMQIYPVNETAARSEDNGETMPGV